MRTVTTGTIYTETTEKYIYNMYDSDRKVRPLIICINIFVCIRPVIKSNFDPNLCDWEFNLISYFPPCTDLSCVPHSVCGYSLFLGALPQRPDGTGSGHSIHKLCMRRQFTTECSAISNYRVHAPMTVMAAQFHFILLQVAMHQDMWIFSNKL